jgi:hypothetical protein
MRKTGETKIEKHFNRVIGTDECTVVFLVSKAVQGCDDQFPLLPIVRYDTY